MFLNRLLAGRARDERGSALIAVIGIMGVASLVTMTMSGLSIGAISYTNTTRSGVQAQTAAESGIAVAAAALAASNCQPGFSNSTDPVYSVVVFFATSSAPGTWSTGCPTTADANQIRFISTGTAGTVVKKVEAIYNFVPNPPASGTGITPSGPAIYSYAQTDSTVSNLTLNQASTARPTIEYLSGSATCMAGSTINGDVVLGAGAASVTSGCTINGDLWASSTVTLQSGTVTGNVNAAGVLSGTSVTLSSSATVSGSVYAAGPVSIAGKTGTNVVAGPEGGLSTFSQQSAVGGSLVTAGTANYPAGAIKGTVTTNKSGIVIPATPVVPGWVDYAYNANDWKTSTGAAYSVITLTSCDTTSLANALNTVQASLTPIILDTRACPTPPDFRGFNLTLNSDTVIIANAFTLGSNDIQSADNTEKRLWMIIPDASSDSAPTCPVNGYAKIVNHVTVGSHVGAMMYSPCPIANSGDVWRGQFYASSVQSSSAFTLNYLPIGLPTVNLSTGVHSPPPGSGVLGTRISIRDLNAG
ncbi:MAG: bactofilin family protein [Microbacteriaceae bacterium]